MASSLFGLTADAVRKHHFPHLEAFSASSAPSATVVSEALDEESARLAGYLALEAVDASAVVSASAAYYQCKRVLRLMVALRIARDMTGQNAEAVKAWQADVDAWLLQLGDGGASFLGEGATASGTSDPDGPTSHISVYGLTEDETTSMSTVVPRLRRDDEL